MVVPILGPQGVSLLFVLRIHHQQQNGDFLSETGMPLPQAPRDLLDLTGINLMIEVKKKNNNKLQ